MTENKSLFSIVIKTNTIINYYYIKFIFYNETIEYQGGQKNQCLQKKSNQARDSVRFQELIKTYQSVLKKMLKTHKNTKEVIKHTEPNIHVPRLIQYLWKIILYYDYYYQLFNFYKLNQKTISNISSFLELINI